MSIKSILISNPKYAQISESDFENISIQKTPLDKEIPPSKDNSERKTVISFPSIHHLTTKDKQASLKELKKSQNLQLEHNMLFEEDKQRPSSASSKSVRQIQEVFLPRPPSKPKDSTLTTSISSSVPSQETKPVRSGSARTFRNLTGTQERTSVNLPNLPQLLEQYRNTLTFRNDRERRKQC